VTKPILPIALLVLCFVCGCASIPADALKLTPQSLQLRQLETRRFDTADEAMILSSSAALLQDLGFTLEESETDLGMLLGSKRRSAVEAGQVAAAILVAALGGGRVATDKEQLMRASVVTHPIGDPVHSIAVRVTFQRIVWNTDGQISKQELLIDEGIYTEFFQKLSKSVFLEANNL
jgi:hypothetical protein